MQQRLNRLIRLIRTVLLALIPLLPVLGGCSDGEPSTASDMPEEKLTVLATVYPLADVARQVGGEYVDVTWVAESGQSLPGHEASLEMRSRAELADFVVSAGEAWAVVGFDDPFRAQRVIRIDILPTAVELDTPGALPWLDPAVARELADELVKRYAQRRPKQQHYFRAQADRFIEQLEQLSQRYMTQLSSRPPRKALVLGEQWDHLLRRFGVTPLRPAGAVNPSAITAGQVRNLRQLAAANGITSVFVAADTPHAVALDLQDRTDLTVLTLDPLGTSVAGGRNSYLDLLRHNLDQLHLGASPAGR